MLRRWQLFLGVFFLTLLGLSPVCYAAFSNGMKAQAVIGQSSFTSSGAATTQTGVNGPYGIAVDTVRNRLFVGDIGNSRVLVFNLRNDNTIATGASASYVLGQKTFTAGGAGTPATQSGIYLTQDVEYDPVDNRLFVADFFNYRILVYDVSTITNGMNASYVLGQSNFTQAVGLNDQSHFGAPCGVAYDSVRKRLFVGDLYSGRILVYDLSSGITNGMSGSYILGQSNFTNTVKATTQSGFRGSPGGPTRFEYDATTNRLFVADQHNHRVVIYDFSGGISNGMNASYVLGQSTFTSSGAATTQAGMRQPQSAIYDPSTQRVFVGDGGNRRTLIYDVSGGITNGMSASYVLGQTSLTSSGGTTTQVGMRSGGDAFALDTAHRILYLSDGSNNRILLFNSNPPTISGTVYSDEGVSTLGTNRQVSLSLNGGAATASGLTTSGGAYTMNVNVLPSMTGGTVLTAYLDGASEKAATVTLASGSSITNLNLYQNRLVVRSDSGSVALTNTHLAQAAGNGDTDITAVYSVTSGVLFLPASKALTVWSGKTYTPGGGIRAGSGVTINGTLSLGNNTLALSGAFVVAGGGSLTPGTSLVVLNGTDQSISGSATFYDLSKTVSASATLTLPAGATQTITGTLTLTGGSCSALLLLRSSTSGAQWIVNPGSVSITYVDMKDGKNSNGSTINYTGNLTGNTTGFSLDASGCSTASSSSSSSTGVTGGGGGGRRNTTTTSTRATTPPVLPSSSTSFQKPTARNGVTRKATNSPNKQSMQSFTPAKAFERRQERQKVAPVVSVPAAARPPSPTPGQSAYQVAVNGLNLRAAPNITAPTRYQLKQGDRVTVFGVVGQTWAKVRLESGREGWVAVSKLKKMP